MKKNSLIKIHNLILVSFLPFIYGCLSGGGGGGEGFAEAISANSSSGITLTNSGSTSQAIISGCVTDCGTQMAQIHNPEPTTMLLLGSGFMAMRHLKKNNKIR